MTLYQNKYRIESAHLRGWDYASDGSYFITICTHEREKFLGRIIQGKMQLNAYGTIVEKCWFDLPNHYKNIVLDAFVIMPDHIHAILIIDNTLETGLRPVSTFEIVRALKSFSSRRMNELDKSPGKTRWQLHFHDHIIRDEQALCRIRQYIINNPSAWKS
jgi:REP element-mobilizing transposase RayT